jgi:thiol-disulfide isomerase/thioredoxin
MVNELAFAILTERFSVIKTNTHTHYTSPRRIENVVLKKTTTIDSFKLFSLKQHRTTHKNNFPHNHHQPHSTMKTLLSFIASACLLFALGKTAVAFQNHANRRLAFFQRQRQTTMLSVSVSANMLDQLTAMNGTATEGGWFVDQRGMSSTFRSPTPISTPSVTTSTTSVHHPPQHAVSTTMDQQLQQVHSIASMEELLQLMDGHGREENRLTLVKFYADYCTLCRRAGMQMRRLVGEFPDVDFTKIEHRVVSAPHAETLRSLGVTRFPWIQLYRGGRCVASFSAGPSHVFVKKVRDTLRLCRERDQEGWEAFQEEFRDPIAENLATRRQLAEALH